MDSQEYKTFVDDINGFIVEEGKFLNDKRCNYNWLIGDAIVRLIDGGKAQKTIKRLAGDIKKSKRHLYRCYEVRKFFLEEDTYEKFAQRVMKDFELPVFNWNKINNSMFPKKEVDPKTCAHTYKCRKCKQKK